VTVITEAELRELWQGGRGSIPPFPPHTRLTPAARDFINQWGITVTFVDEVERSSNQSAEGPSWKEGGLGEGNRISQLSNLSTIQPSNPVWDKPGEFPVNLSGPLPTCTVCGQPVTKKPPHMAQLDATHFAPKTAPRFVLRGKMDTLHAHFLLATGQARRFSLPELANYLTTLAAYCREITSAEYHEREVAPLQLAGLSEADIREASHQPDRTIGIPHVIPGPDDHEMVLQLNLLRCQVREAELVAAAVFTGPDGLLSRSDLVVALNRLSSAVYYLILLLKAGKIAWKIPGGLG
jgi:ethanolamine utilization cobalamin adenosyltransferase